MVISQGHIYWANLPDPTGSGPGFRRPVLVVQGDALNRSRVRTVVCIALTSNLRWVEAPGNVLLPTRATGLPKDSVANASQIITLDRELLTEEVGKLSKRQFDRSWPVVSRSRPKSFEWRRIGGQRFDVHLKNISRNSSTYLP